MLFLNITIIKALFSSSAMYIHTHQTNAICEPKLPVLRGYIYIHTYIYIYCVYTHTHMDLDTYLCVCVLRSVTVVGYNSLLMLCIYIYMKFLVKP
jgi:hypothetical protein